MKANEQTILLVDTEPKERRIIRDHLSSKGYGIVEAANEKEILEKITRQPALVLLDILAPGMDGIQTCRKLKAEDATCHIPVVFLTTDTNAQTLELIFDAGGVDYVKKPVVPQVLFARIATHIMLRDRQLHLDAGAQRIARLEGEKTQLLIDADRLATLSAFSSTCAHEINNPISYIMGNAELIKFTWQRALPIVEKHLDEDATGHLKKSAERLDSKLDHIIEGADRVSQKVREFRVFSRKPENVKKDCRLSDVVNDAVSLLAHRLKQGFKIDADVSREVKIHGEPQKLSQVFVNLFNDAMDTMAPGKGTVFIETLRNNGRVEIRVRGDGPNKKPENALESVVLGRGAKERDDENGLGLLVAQCIIEGHNGEMRCANCANSGAHFDITLPAAVG